VPVPANSKPPAFAGWPNLVIPLENLSAYFGSNQNIGVCLGTRSGDLADIDLDCVEALALADLYLPCSQAVFGRPAKPRSHRLFIANGAVKEAFVDPLSGDTLLELRADGRTGRAHQSLFPPSIVDGEQRVWDGDIVAPRVIEAVALRQACAWLAIGCLMMRHLSEHAARRPGPDMPSVLWEADHKLGGAAYRWLGLPNPDMPRLRPRHRRDLSADEIDLAEIMAAIPNNEGWDGWVAVGLAIFAASDGSDQGGILWDAWSAKSPKYNPYTTTEKWREFHRYPPDSTGVGKLVKMAIEAGWRSSRIDRSVNDRRR
jgi:hypothetical protein